MSRWPYPAPHWLCPPVFNIRPSSAIFRIQPCANIMPSVFMWVAFLICLCLMYGNGNVLFMWNDPGKKIDDIFRIERASKEVHLVSFIGFKNIYRNLTLIFEFY